MEEPVVLTLSKCERNVSASNLQLLRVDSLIIVKIIRSGWPPRISVIWKLPSAFAVQRWLADLATAYKSGLAGAIGEHQPTDITTAV